MVLVEAFKTSLYTTTKHGFKIPLSTLIPTRRSISTTTPLQSMYSGTLSSLYRTFPSHNTKSMSSLVQIDDQVEMKLREILSTFHAPIRFAAAYGSGVFKQNGYQQQPMIDFIFGVTHPEHWHSLNMRQHPHHYSCIRHAGSETVVMLQDKMGAGIYYNPYVQVKDSVIKYGVVSIDTLQKDLRDWNTFYLAGRLQKPVAILQSDARIQLANKLNRMNAVRVASLLLPREFSEEELFLTIAGLSYSGDFRMKVRGENPYKIYNIVHTQMDYFRALYKPIIEELPHVNYIDENNLVQDEEHVKVKIQLLQQLPKEFMSKLKEKHRLDLLKKGASISQVAASGQWSPKKGEDDVEFLSSLAKSPHLSLYARKSLVELVRYPALTQAIKGLVTAGPLRSLRYIQEKLTKANKAAR